MRCAAWSGWSSVTAWTTVKGVARGGASHRTPSEGGEPVDPGLPGGAFDIDQFAVADGDQQQGAERATRQEANRAPRGRAFGGPMGTLDAQSPVDW
jgi:hypothetical protein